MATLGIGTVSNRLEENPEVDDAKKHGAAKNHILEFFLIFLFTLISNFFISFLSERCSLIFLDYYIKKT